MIKGLKQMKTVANRYLMGRHLPGEEGQVEGSASTKL